MPSAVELANDVVHDYVEHKSQESFDRLQRERHGEGCGCINCQKAAVSDINAWLSFLDPEEQFPRYKLDTKKSGKPTIVELEPVKK